MTTYVKDRISELMEMLKANNELFPDHIYFYDPLIDNPSGFDGITDALANYAYVQEIQDDIPVIPDQFQIPKDWGRQMFKLVAMVTSADRSTLLRFCMTAIVRTNSAKLVAYSDQSQRIYFEETGQEIRSDLNLVRCIFIIPELIDCTQTISLCQTPNC